jgi:zinc protease
MLDRKIAPDLHEVIHLPLPSPKTYTLDNGIKVYETRLGTQEVMKLEVIFLSGRPQEQKKLAARVTSRMMKEGTANYSSSQIAEELEFLAGTLRTYDGLDYAGLGLYCMTKHFEKLLPLISDMILQPTFPEKELATYIENNIQRLNVDLTKNETIAYRKITEYIFGETHPYGYNSVPDTYRALTRTDLVNHYKEQYTADNTVIFLSGRTNDQTLSLLNTFLGKHQTKKKIVLADMSVVESKPKNINIENSADTSQKAIRIGRRLFTRSHPDFMGMVILNTVLGGYFSSRLMTNIREKKGYTYNIYSNLETMFLDGGFYIGTEVSNEFADKTLKEIYKEIRSLRTKLIPDGEMEMLRSYLEGNMLNMVDGPFAISDAVKTLILEGMDLNSFTEMIKILKNITPQDLMDLAIKYLDKKDLWEVVVG